MCRFTSDTGAIRQAEFFVYRQSDKNALIEALNRYSSGSAVEPTTWIRALRRDVELIAKLGVKETGMLASASDYHMFHKFKPGGRRQAAELYLEAVKDALNLGIRPRLHLEDATRANRDFVLLFLEMVNAAASKFPKELAPKIRICDTMGLGLPGDNVAWPRSVPKLIRTVIDAGIPGERLEFHPHNDAWLIVANCIAAVEAGCCVINGTLLGKGERTGNAPLEAVLLHLCGMGYYQEKIPNFLVLNEMVEFYASIGFPLPAKYPLFGDDAHRTRAGIHADGLNKNWRMYAPFDVQKLIGRNLEVSLTKDSGISGVQFVLRQHLGKELSKDHPIVEIAHKWIESEFEDGRMTSVEWEELDKKLNQIAPREYEIVKGLK
jgi:2-phosphinomethylmalic acid synthase